MTDRGLNLYRRLDAFVGDIQWALFARRRGWWLGNRISDVRYWVWRFLRQPEVGVREEVRKITEAREAG